MERIALVLLVLFVVTGIEARPFLKCPFAKSVAPTIIITEGWEYGAAEQQIHGFSNHKAIDFATKYGTSVYASADGLAIQSFHSRLLPDRLWKGKGVGFGLGHFVQIWHPEQKLFTCYAHLSWVVSSIPYISPVQSQIEPHDWDPKGIYLPNGVVPEGVVEVRQGQLIGYVGDSGLTWGYNETPDQRLDRGEFPSWDEPHLHFEVYTRDADGQKDQRFDPFCIYSTCDAYDLPNPVSVASLWLTDLEHHLIWAK